MSAIDDAEAKAVGAIVAATRLALSELVTDVQAADLIDEQALQDKLDQATMALTAETTLEQQDQAAIAALNVTVAQLQAQIVALEAGGDLVPKGSLVIGTSTNTGQPDMATAQFGLPALAVFRYYREATDADTTVASMASKCAAAGTLLVMSTKIPNNDHLGLSQGKYDAFLKGRCDALSSAGAKTVLIVHHEPENDITATGNMTADAYSAGQVHVAQFLQAYPTIIFSTAAMGSWYSTWAAGKKADFDAMYPEPSIYPVFGFDRYEESYAGHESHHTVDQLVTDVVQVFRSHGVTAPLALWEHGVRVDPTQVGYAATWLKTLYLTLRLLDVRLASYFFSGRNSANGPWYWTDKSDERQAVLGGALSGSDHVALK